MRRSGDLTQLLPVRLLAAPGARGPVADSGPKGTPRPAGTFAGRINDRSKIPGDNNAALRIKERQ